MRRVPHDELVMDIKIAFSTLPGYLKTTLRRFGNGELDAEIIAAMLADRLDNRSSMVIATECVGGPNSRPGIWGVDEPDPAGPARAWNDVSKFTR